MDNRDNFQNETQKYSGIIFSNIKEGSLFDIAPIIRNLKDRV